ncbi:MAG: hypothetical protein IT432_17350 [Phycisphaerales bacterium]|nr:hypothetical protein [Phycisphaerales bacterium]
MTVMHCARLEAGVLPFASLLAMVSICGTASGQATFTRIQSLDEHNRWTRVTGISADGMKVVGRSMTDKGTFEGFVWSNNAGAEGVGSLLHNTSAAEAISGDGSVVVGSTGRHSYQRTEAFKWTQDEKIESLGIQSSMSTAYGASHDGRVIVGQYDEYPEQAFRMDASGMTNIGDLGGGRASARDVSAGGATVVGWSDVNFERTEAFVWTAQTGMQGLGTLGGSASYAWAISPDGGTVVGSSRFDHDSEDGHAFMWNAQEGLVDLGAMDDLFSVAWDVSQGGKVIVGETYIAPFGPTRAFVWDRQNGMVDLNEYAKDVLKLSIDGWELQSAKAVSDDGMYIAGDGLSPEGEYAGWVIRVPTPGTLVVMGAALGMMRRRR